MEKIKLEMKNEDDVEFVAEWKGSVQMSRSTPNTKRKIELNSMSFVEIKIAQNLKRIEHQASTSHDPLGEDVVFKCGQCSETFHQQSELRKHSESHGKNTERDDTNTSNSVKKNPEAMKSFSCNYCKRVLKVKSNLLRHVKDVHNSVPVSCQICSKIFSCDRNRRRHMQRVHKQ